MGPVSQTVGMPTNMDDTQDAFHVRKGIEGFIVSHSWRERIVIPEAVMEKQGFYPQYDYKNEEFAYTTKEEAIKKVDELLV